MDAGTELRKKTGRGDVLALLAVAKIRDIRMRALAGQYKSELTLQSRAYILNSLKHPDEARALRRIYGRLFILVSAYMPREKRLKGLARAIAKSRGASSEHDKHLARAEKLINRDEEEEGEKLGQDVTDVFPQADFFVATDNSTNLKAEVSRFVEIVFAYQFHTPSQDEMGMYLARSAALRSADLSRQVGAAICTAEGDLLSVGCNEIPKAGGGQYWPSDARDDRDHKRGYDSGAQSRNNILREVIERMKAAKMLSRKFSAKDNALKFILGDAGNKIFGGMQILNLLEFGRPVHAEMAAITGAAMRGISIFDSTLFTTTFPCHICARHIISSGIKRVVYVEPYPKSRVRDLYSDSVEIDRENDSDQSKVQFLPFVGVSPRRYQEFFEIYGRRKDNDGNKAEWSAPRSSPRIERIIATYPVLEAGVVDSVQQLLVAKGFMADTNVNKSRKKGN